MPTRCKRGGWITRGALLGGVSLALWPQSVAWIAGSAKMSVTRATQAASAARPVGRWRSSILRQSSTRQRQTAEAAAEPPADWQSQFDELRGLRGWAIHDPESEDAEAVKASDPEVAKLERFEVFVSLILSANTNDNNVAKAMALLRADGPVTPTRVRDTPIDELQELVRPSGFYKTKARYLKAAAERCLEKFEGDVPRTLQEAVEIPGVGPKIGNLLMQCAWGRIEGIAVDTHVHRIANRLAWVKSKDREGTRKQLEAWLPRTYWMEINFVLVGLGKTICKARSPKCDECPLRSSCPRIGVK